ncbi:MAG: glucose-1-phosphate thymidylyltransferase [Limnochordales bacterium]|nr:glucose-1-phosphate thymidylyltransferase [Limnochordales bacterium]
MWRPEEFFDSERLRSSGLWELFAAGENVWEALARLEEFLREQIARERERGTLRQGRVAEGAWVGPDVYVGPEAVVEPGAYIIGPAWIGGKAVVRHAAYIRENVWIADGALVGHATEVKASIFLERAQAPHFNYVGDSILGFGVNLGAGTRLSNLKNDGSEVTIRLPDGSEIRTGRRKLGAILGDGVKTGCNAVLNPGTLIGPETLVYPGAVVRGYIPGHSIVKVRPVQEVVPRESRSNGGLSGEVRH